MPRTTPSPRGRTPTPERRARLDGPRRTCVGCRADAAKRELIRLARSSEGWIEVDRRGSTPGRGAYVHPDRGCIDRALARGAAAVFRALRAGADPDAAARLRRDIEGELRA